MVGGAVLAAWIPFWTFASALSTLDFMRTSGGHPSIGTFYLPAGISAGLTVVGIGVMVYAFILLSHRTSQSFSDGTSVPMAGTVPPEKADKHEPGLDVLPPGVTLPDGRTISTCRLEDLIAIYKENTTDQANRLLVGKWIKFSGEVHDNQGDGSVYIVHSGIFGMPSPVLVWLQFGKGWEEPLSTLRRGSSITARGQIVRVSSAVIRLERCELL
jgi:hypothetical protein